MLDGDDRALQSVTLRDFLVQSNLGNERETGKRQGPAERSKHRSREHGLRRGNAGVGIAHLRTGDHPPLEHQLRLHTEEGGLPEHQVGPFARLEAADVPGDAVRDGRADGVFGDIAFGTRVVVADRVAVERAKLRLHLVRCLPGADDHLADAAHGLRVGADHAQAAAVMQDILGRDRFRANPAFGEGHVFRNGARQVVTDHEHVEMLVDGIDREGPRRVGARGQDVRQAGDANDVRRVAAAGAFRVIGVNRTALDRGNGIFDEARLVQRVRVDGDLDVVLIGHAHTAVDGRGGRAPIFVQFQAAGSGADLLHERPWQAAIAFAQEAEVDRKRLGCLEHALDVPGARCAGGGVGPCGRPGAAAQEGRQATGQRCLT